ncbi:putative signal transduction protein with CBS domain containing protein [Desulfovibrio sp. X2]|uniref:chloride channel protein n=1 Tax=Desulfovibrio sp. X2 TaxID=941449 RepID=UPI000358BF33|nr:chloride channel protein [Desulfovibrio sp. X2]EPR37677.1 putative signal transduction protein with CBS domain containing protein [Desulfovibrio sp. X2]
MPDERTPTLLRDLSWFRAHRHMTLLLVAIAVGVLGGYGAVLFRLVIKLAQGMFYGRTGDIMDFFHVLPRWMFVVMPAAGGLVVGLLARYGAREARGPGVPEVREAVLYKGGHIRKRVALVKILASAVCIGSGGSVGREGPIVQIGASVGSTLGQLLDASAMQRKTLVGCGAAAGIAATFNAPIAGVLFSLEVLLGDFGLTSFSPVVLSSVTATVISRHYFGDFPAFVIPVYHLRSVWEYPLYAGLGLCCGLVAVLFITALYSCEDFFDRLRLPEPLKPMLGGLAMGLLVLALPQVFGVGYGAINQALVDRLAAPLLLCLIFGKIAATSVVLASGGSGGVFAPSLFIGAMTGGAFGYAAHALAPGLTAGPGAYALVAMGALVAGSTHAPITAILIIFEMTNDYRIILPLMISCILSTLLAGMLKKGNIYTLKLLRRGVNLKLDPDLALLHSIPVTRHMRTKIATVPEDMPLPGVVAAFEERDVPRLHVVDREQRLRGVIGFGDLRAVLMDAELLGSLVVAGDMAENRLAVLHPADSILTAMRRMEETGFSHLPVVDPESGRLLGTIEQKDVFAVYGRIVLDEAA